MCALYSVCVGTSLPDFSRRSTIHVWPLYRCLVIFFITASKLLALLHGGLGWPIWLNICCVSFYVSVCLSVYLPVCLSEHNGLILNMVSYLRSFSRSLHVHLSYKLLRLCRWLRVHILSACILVFCITLCRFAS